MFLFPPALLGIVLVACGGFKFQLEAWSFVAAKFSTIRFIPLYHHYFSTETMAMVSLMVHISMYSLLGFIFWLWAPNQTRPYAGYYGWLAVFIALLINILKLLLVSRQPDMTDLLIAYFSSKYT